MLDVFIFPGKMLFFYFYLCYSNVLTIGAETFKQLNTLNIFHESRQKSTLRLPRKFY